MYNILIIGSHGFIGSHCVREFSKKHNVFSADIIADNRLNYFRLSETNTNFDALFKNNEFKICINCSGSANVSDSFTNPVKDFQLNTVNVFNILESIKNHSPNCKFINISSAAVYGNPVRNPINEVDELQPISNYGFHKQFAESICKQFYLIYGVHSLSVRVFSAYGPGLKKQLIWDLYQKTLRNQNRIELFGTGEETRDFIFIDDIIQALDLLIQKGQFQGETYNLASGTETSIQTLASLLIKNLKWYGELEFNNKSLPGYPTKWQADITKLFNSGFLPTTKLEEGIKITAEWLKKQ